MIDFYPVPKMELLSDVTSTVLRLRRCLAYLKNAIHEANMSQADIEDEFSDDYVKIESLCVALYQIAKPLEILCK